MKSTLDSDGQPLISSFNAPERAERDVAEMLGLVKGVLSDGKVTPDECRLLNAWILAHPDAVMHWPGNVISDRVKRIFEDGKVTKAERDRSP